MSVVGLTACSGSPGTTTSAHALAACWPRRCVLLEADPDGGHLAARLGLSIRPGLVDLAAIVRSGRIELEDMARVAQRDADGVDVVVAHPAVDQVSTVLRSAARRIGHAVARVDDVDVIVDLGRLRPSSEALPLLAECAQVLLLTGTRLEDVAALVHRRRWLAEVTASAHLGLLVTAQGEHSAEEVARAVDVPLIGVRPGRSSRRTTERRQRREATWLRSVALQLADRTDDSPRSLLSSSLSGPSGPAHPGPSPIPELTS